MGATQKKMKVVRSFSLIEPQKFGFSALAGCFLVSITFFVAFKPYVVSSPILSLQVWSPPVPTILIAKDKSIPKKLDARSESRATENKPKCNVLTSGLNLCEEDGVGIQKKSSIISDHSPQTQDGSSSQQLDLGIKNKTEDSEHKCNPKSGLCEVNGDMKLRNNSSMVTTSPNQNPSVNTSLQLETARSGDQMQLMKPMCNFSDPRADVCEMDGDVRLLGKSSSVILVRYSEMAASLANESWSIRPYARKGDDIAMNNVKELSLKSITDPDSAPACTVNHNIPSIIFSMGGFSGNLFHGFTDVIIPLFLTSRQYEGEVQFLITDFEPWWIIKHNQILQQLSNYDLIDFDKDDRVHCFPHVIVGLHSHKEFTIDPSRSPNGYSMLDFTKFLRTSFSLERDTPIRIGENLDKKPRLLIIARKRTRAFLNVNDIVQVAQELGYEVIVSEPEVASNLARFARIVNSCDVMMGVHGAGLTNSLFLPTNGVLIQVVPWGGLEWVSNYDYGEPALDMKLNYLQYNIKAEESSLIWQYPRDHPIFTDPVSIHKQGWLALREVFLDKQSIKIDVERFRAVLVEALKLLHK